MKRRSFTWEVIKSYRFFYNVKKNNTCLKSSPKLKLSDFLVFWHIAVFYCNFSACSKLQRYETIFNLQELNASYKQEYIYIYNFFFVIFGRRRGPWSEGLSTVFARRPFDWRASAESENYRLWIPCEHEAFWIAPSAKCKLLWEK